MAIQINGNGTITGISVGGLPDGIVDTDTIANNAVTNAKATGIAGGKVLQTATGTTSTQIENTTTTWADTGLSASITPSATDSKILVMVSQAFEITATNSSDAGGSMRLLRDSTVIDSATSGGGNAHKYYTYAQGVNNISFYGTYSLTFLDPPNTTSSVTYKTQSAMYYGSHRIKTQSSSIPSYITLMEIAA